MKRFWKKLGPARFPILFFLLTALFSALLTFFLKSESFSSWLLRQLNRELGSRFSLKVEAGKISLDPWRLRIEATDLKIRPLADQAEKLSFRPLISIERISLNLALLPLLRRRLHFQQVLVRAPELKFEFSDATVKKRREKMELAFHEPGFEELAPSAKELFLKEKKSTPDKKNKSKPSGLPSIRNWAFRFDDLRVETDFLSLIWPKPGRFHEFQRIDLKNLELKIFFDRNKGRHQGSLGIGAAWLERKDIRQLFLESSRFGFHSDRAVLRLDGLIRGQGFSLEAISVCQLEPEFIWKEAHLEGEFWPVSLPFFSSASLSRSSSSPPPIAFSGGKIEFLLNLSGKKEALSGDFSIRGENLGWSLAFLREAEKTLLKMTSHDFLRKGPRVQEDPVSGRKGRPKDPAFLKTSFEGQGRFSLPLISGRPAFLSLEGDYSFRFDGPENSPAPKIRGEIQGKLRQGESTVDRLHLSLPGFDLSASAKIKEYRYLDLAGSAEIYLPELFAFVNVEKLPVSPKKERTAGKPIISGTLILEGKISGSLSDLQGSIRLESQNLALPLLAESELEARAELKRRSLYIKDFHLLSRAAEIKLAGSLSFDSGDSRMAKLMPSVDLYSKIKIRDLSLLSSSYLFQFTNLSKLLQGKSRKLPAFGGSFLIEAKWKSQGRSFNSSFSLIGTDLILGSERMASLEIEGHLSSEHFQISRALIKKTMTSPPIRGFLNFKLQEKVIQASVEAPLLDLENFASLSSLKLSGRAGFDLKIGGRKDDFSLIYKIEGKRLRSSLFSFPEVFLSGEIALAGKKIRSSHMEVIIGPEGIELGFLPLFSSGPISLDFKNGSILLSGFNWRGENFSFSLEGSLGLEEERGEINLKGRFPLSLMENFLTSRGEKEISSGGEVEIEGKIGGSLKNLKPKINFSLKEGFLHLPFLLSPVEKINLIARIEPQALEVEKFSFNLGRGFLAARARLPLAALIKDRLPATKELNSSDRSSAISSPELKLTSYGNHLVSDFSSKIEAARSMVEPQVEPKKQSPEISPLPENKSPKKEKEEGEGRGTLFSRKSRSKESLNKVRIAKARGIKATGSGTELRAGKEEVVEEEAEINLHFDDLNPLLLLPAFRTKISRLEDLEEKIKSGEIAAELSGKIDFKGRLNSVLLAGSDLSLFSSFSGGGKFQKIVLKFKDFKLVNSQPIAFNFEPDLFRLEKACLKNELFQLVLEGRLTYPLSLFLEAGEGQLNRPELNFSLQAAGDLKALSLFVEDLILSGQMALNFYVSGPSDFLKMRSSLEFRSLAFERADWSVRLSSSNGYLFFSGRRLRLQSLRGLVNGAPWEIQGYLDFKPDLKIDSAGIQIRARDVPVEFGDLFEATTGFSLDFKADESGSLLSGEINLSKTRVTADLGSTLRLMRRRSFFRRQMSGRPLFRFMENLSLRLRLNLEEPAVISNSMLQAQIQGALTLSGSFSQPFLFGRLINPGPGELTWAERKYKLIRLEVNFTGSFPPNPYLEIQAQTKVIHRYDELEVRLNLSGPMANLRFNFESTPPRSPEELAFLVITGKSPEEIRSRGLGALREQILLFLASPAASYFGGTLRRLLGIEEVRLEPLKVAGETDPGARLTLVKQITPAARVTSSIDITNSQRQTWALDYQLRKGLIFQGYRFDDGSFGAGLRQSFSLGEEKLPKEKGGAERRKISELRITGDLAFPEKEIRKKVDSLREGRVFTSSNLDRGIRSLEAFYRKKNYLQVRIEPRIETEGEENIKIVLEIKAGQPVYLDFEGASVPREIRRQMEKVLEAEPDLERGSRLSARLIEDYFKGKGHLRATVSFSIEDVSSGKNEAGNERETPDRKNRSLNEYTQNPSDEIDPEFEAGRDRDGEKEGKFFYGGKIIRFRIEPGPNYILEKMEIEGVSEKRRRELLRTIKSWKTERARGFWLLVVDSRNSLEALKAFYEDQGFLDAKIKLEIEERIERPGLSLRLKIDEGPRSHLASVRIEGNRAVETDELMTAVRSRAGDIFNPTKLLSDRNNLLAFYRHRGFRQASVSTEVVRADSGPDVELVFKIEEGPLSRIESIEFTGIKENERAKLASIFSLKPGEPLLMERLSLGQRALYRTGDFNFVQVMTEELPGKPGEVKVRVELRPEPKINVLWGLRYNSQEKTEVTAGANFHRLFGSGRHGLINYRQNERERDFRFSLHDRNFLGLKIESLLSFYLSRKNEATFVTDEYGLSWRYQFSLPAGFLASAILRRSHIHTYEKTPLGPFPFDVSLSLTELSLQIVRDRRDDPLDSRRGTFFSSSLTYSPAALRSDLTYLSWFGQVSIYLPLAGRLVSASNFRLGLATAFDQVMVPARRFYAGGSYSLRGFKQDMVGPVDPYLKQPEGGEALFIFNQEIRFSLFPGLDGVIFYDAGNVFPEVKDLSLKSLRPSLGFGLRLRSSLGLLRFDLGFNLRPKPGEPKRVFSFGLGHPF